jgi:predicted transposase YbfD/YdcC
MKSSSPPKGVPAITRHFATLEDPRVVGRCSYPLETLLVIALLAVICGAEGWTDLESFAESKASWLATFLEMPGRPPKEKAFRDLFEAIRPAAFEACMRAWVQSLAESLKGQVVAFDGKTLRGALRKAFGRTALHQVHAWVGAQHLLLAKEAVEGAPEEGAAIRAMLDALDLEGAIVTMDAGNTAAETAQKVLDERADYVVTLKANRQKLYLGVRGFFEAAEADGFAGVRVHHQQTRDHGHGRDEVRDVWVVAASALGEVAAQWPGLQSVVMIRRSRVLADGTVQQWTHFYLSSLPPRVKRLAEVIREHWSVENGLHWILDVQMREDDCTIRNPNGATNFALLRRMALMLLKRDDTTDRGVRGKQKKAGWNDDYLLHILTRGTTGNEAI